VKKRKWERKRRRGKKKICYGEGEPERERKREEKRKKKKACWGEDELEREKERGKRKLDKISLEVATVPFIYESSL
jgi:hypothetical protein